MVSITGNNENNTLFGTNDNDTISGFKGDDLINYSSGDDFLIGGDGNDTFNFVSGSETNIAFVNRDTIIGGNGDDYVNLTIDPQIFGFETISDFVTLPSGVIYTGDGNDFVTAMANNSNNKNVIDLGTGNDYLSLSVDSVPTLTKALKGIYPDLGYDILSTDFRDAITDIKLDLNVVGTNFESVPSVYGGLGNDLIIARNSDFDTSAPAYLYSGQSGNDTLIGGNGNDVLTANRTYSDGTSYRNGQGTALLTGGLGRDTFTVDFIPGTPELPLASANKVNPVVISDFGKSIGETIMLNPRDTSGVALESDFGVLLEIGSFYDNPRVSYQNISGYGASNKPDTGIFYNNQLVVVVADVVNLGNLDY